MTFDSLNLTSVKPDLDAQKLATSIYVEEYKSLRSEQMQRVQTQNQAFNFLITAVGSSVAGLIASANSSNPAAAKYLPLIVFLVSIVLSALSGWLACIFFDNEIEINAIGLYLTWEVRPRLRKGVIQAHSIVDHVDCGGRDILDNHHYYDRLPDSALEVFKHASYGRWLPFVFITMASPLLGVLFAVGASSPNSRFGMALILGLITAAVDGAGIYLVWQGWMAINDIRRRKEKEADRLKLLKYLVHQTQDQGEMKFLHEKLEVHKEEPTPLALGELHPYLLLANPSLKDNQNYMQQSERHRPTFKQLDELIRFGQVQVKHGSGAESVADG